MSNIRTGDAVFIRSGNPGVVRGRDELTGKLELDTELANVQKDMRHGYVNGMEMPERERFNDILDSIKSDAAEPRERVEALQTKVTELEDDPKNFALVRYLKAEMVHIMNTHSIKPKQYSAHETKIK